MMEFIEGILFKPGALDAQIHSSIQSVQTIGEAFAELTAEISEKKSKTAQLHLIYIALRAKLYCEEISPGSTATFPDFQKILEKMEPLENDELLKMNYMLRALSYNPDLSQLKPIQRQEAVLTMLEAMMLNTSKLSDIYCLKIQVHFETRFSGWENQIEKLLSDRKTCDQLLHALLISIGAADEPIGGSWKRIDRLLFQNGDVIIDLALGKVYGLNWHQNQLESVKSMQHVNRALDSATSKLQQIRQGVFQTPDKKFKIELSKNNNAFEVAIVREIEGINYRYQQSLPELIGLIPEYTNDDETVLWVEETESKVKKICVQPYSHPGNKSFYTYDPDSPQGIVRPKVEPKPVEVPVDSYKESLQALSRFCPLNNIKAYAIEGQKQLSFINLKSRDLFFKVVKNENGKLIATTERFPEYHIAENQEHPALEGIASYLILENGGKKQVLIPKGQWMQALVGMASSYAGPFSKLLMKAISSTANSQDFYCYEIEPATSTKPKASLQSQDPEAMIYLMTLYFFQDNHEALERAYQKFEWICNIKPVPENALAQLIPLAIIPIKSGGIAHFRRRLFAALMQNRRLVEQEKKFENPKADKKFYISALGQEVSQSTLLDLTLGFSALMDLRDYLDNPNPRESLSIHQEYFLYQFAFERLSNILKSLTPDSGKDGSVINNALDAVGLENLIEFMGLSENLNKRYLEIKKSMGIKDSLITSACNLAARIQATPSNLPEFVYQKENKPQTQVESREDFLAKALHVLSIFKNNRFTNIGSLKLEEYHQTMSNRILPFPNLDPSRITPDVIKRSFPTYYAIAKGDWNNSFDPKEKPPREKLAYLLKILKGTGDRQSEVLMTYLEAILEYPDEFPPTKELLESRKESKTQIQRIEPGLSAHEKKYREWHKFFKRLNDLTYGKMMGQEIVEPIYQSWVLSLGSYLAAETLGSHLLPGNLLPGGLLQMGTAVASRVIKNTIAEKLLEAGQPLKKYIPGPTSLLMNGSTSEPSWKRTAMKSAQVVGTVGLTFAANYALSQVLPTMPSLNFGLSAVNPTVAQQIAFQGLSLAGAAMLRVGLAKTLDQNVRLNQVLPYSYVTAPALSWLNKVYNYYASSVEDDIHKEGADSSEKTNSVKVDYSVLEGEDKAVDDFLSRQFDLAFLEEAATEDPEEIRFEKLPVRDSDSPVLKDRYKRVNESREAYYDQKDRLPSTFRVKNEKSLMAMYINLKKFRAEFARQIDLEKSQLLDIFNTGGKTGQSRLKPLTMTDLHNLLDKGSLGKIGKQVGLSNEDLPNVELAAGRIEHKTSRLQQIDRILAIMNDLPRNAHDKTSAKYIQKIEQLAIELRTSPAFSLKNTPSKLLRKFLQFQAGTKTLLWKKQVENRQKALYGEEGSIATEESPGSGKTFYAIPTTAAHESDGKTYVESIPPKQLAGVNMPEFHEMLWTVFGKRSHVQRISREMPLDAKKLQALLVLAKGSLKAGEPNQKTKEDAQALQSIFFDRMHRYRHTPGAATEEERECLILLKKILHVLRSKGKDIPDETHETYLYRKQLNYPIGAPKTIPGNLYFIAEACMRYTIRDPDLQPLIQANKLYTIDKKNYRRTIKPRIAEEMSRYWRFDIKEESCRKEFIEFVCDKSKTVPAWISSDPKLYSEISLVKGILNDLLPMNFKKRAQVNYGAGKNGKEEFARPSDGNSHVLESDTIRLPYETLIKTFLMLGTTSLNKNQSFHLLDKLRNMARNDMKKHHIAYEDTLVYKKFGSFITESILAGVEKNSKSSPEEQAALEKLSRHPDAQLLYMRHFIWKQIHYWKHNISNSSNDFAGIYAKHYSNTGTPDNDGTWPVGLKLLGDPTILGEAIHIISKKCPKDGIHILNSDQPQEILSEILSRFFMPDSSFSAIIDGGALFTGMENESVAKIMAEYCKEHRPDIKAIKYFKEDENGLEKIHYLRIVNSQEEPEPKDCLAYYDERHGFGAHMPQEGDGYSTIGPGHRLAKLIQEALRIRNLKKEERLKAIEEMLVQMKMQKIHFGMTRDVLEMIKNRDPKNPAPRPFNIPEMAEVLDFLVRNEAATAEEENYPATRQKYTSMPKLAAYDKILDTPDEQFDDWMAVFDDFETTFVTELKDDPAELFGKIKSKVAPEVALKMVEEKAIEKINASKTFTEEDKQKFKTNIAHIPHPVMQEKVKIMGNGTDAATDALADLGLEQTVVQTAEQSAQVNTEQQQQTQNEQEQQAEQQSYMQNSSKLSIYKEWDWPQISDPASIDWLKFDSPSKQALGGLFNSITSWFTTKECPFFKVRDLLSETTDEALSKLSHAFDNRLWMPNNFVPRWVSGLKESPVEIGSKQQFNLFEVLIHVEEVDGKLKILDMGPLSIRDAAMWRKKLSVDKDYWKDKKVKTILWDVSSQSVQAGYAVDASFREDADLKTLTGQLKFLNSDVKYANEHKEMFAWLKANDPKALQEAFDVIHARRGIGSMHGSQIDHMFMDARDFPFEELM